MAPRVRKFVDRSFARTVDLTLLHRLLEPYLDRIGFGWTSLPDDDKAKREAVFQLFQNADAKFPPELQFALFNISTLSTESGARLIQDIASEADVDVLVDAKQHEGAESENFTPRYIALLAWLDHPHVFNRALRVAAFWSFAIKIERDADRDGLEPRHHDGNALAAFKQEVSRHFFGRYNGRYCDVRWYNENDSVKALVLHGTKSDTKNIEKDGGEGTIKFREIVQSTIEFDRARSSVAVGSKSTTDAKKLVKLFAEHLMGDATLFDASEKDELYTLEPMRRAGPNFWFRRKQEDDITKVVIREVRIDESARNAGGRISRSPWMLTIRDSEHAIRRLLAIAPEVDLAHVRLLQAKIDVFIDVDGHDAIVPVTIKPPRILSIRDHSHERIILDMLELNDIRKARRARQAAAAAE